MQIFASYCYLTGAGTVFARVYPISFIGDGCRFRFVNRTSPQFVTEKLHNPDSIDAQYPDHIKTLLIQSILFLRKPCLSICQKYHLPLTVLNELRGWGLKAESFIQVSNARKAESSPQQQKGKSNSICDVCLFLLQKTSSYYRCQMNFCLCVCLFFTSEDLSLHQELSVIKKHEFSFMFWIFPFILVCPPLGF